MNIRYGRFRPIINAIKWFLIVLIIEIVIFYMYTNNEYNTHYGYSYDYKSKPYIYGMLILPSLFALNAFFSRNDNKQGLDDSFYFNFPNLHNNWKIASSISLLWMFSAGLFFFVYDPFDGYWRETQWRRAFFVILAPVGMIGLATAMYSWIRKDQEK